MDFRSSETILYDTVIQTHDIRHVSKVIELYNRENCMGERGDRVYGNYAFFVQFLLILKFFKNKSINLKRAK